MADRHAGWVKVPLDKGYLILDREGESRIASHSRLYLVSLAPSLYSLTVYFHCLAIACG